MHNPTAREILDATTGDNFTGSLRNKDRSRSRERVVIDHGDHIHVTEQPAHQHYDQPTYEDHPTHMHYKN